MLGIETKHFINSISKSISTHTKNSFRGLGNENETPPDSDYIDILRTANEDLLMVALNPFSTGTSV